MTLQEAAKVLDRTRLAVVLAVSRELEASRPLEAARILGCELGDMRKGAAVTAALIRFHKTGH